MEYIKGMISFWVIHVDLDPFCLSLYVKFSEAAFES